jgi:hypothetical protein
LPEYNPSSSESVYLVLGERVFAVDDLRRRAERPGVGGRQESDRPLAQRTAVEPHGAGDDVGDFHRGAVVIEHEVSKPKRRQQAKQTKEQSGGHRYSNEWHRRSTRSQKLARPAEIARTRDRPLRTQGGPRGLDPTLGGKTCGA